MRHIEMPDLCTTKKAGGLRRISPNFIKFIWKQITGNLILTGCHFVRICQVKTQILKCIYLINTDKMETAGINRKAQSLNSAALTLAT